MNLLKETKHIMECMGEKPEDIIFIGALDSEYRCTWDEFCVLADQYYHAGFGAQKVAKDLVIVFKNGRGMWREEYDGAEGWEYTPVFKIPEGSSKKIESLFVGRDVVGWQSLKAIHKKR